MTDTNETIVLDTPEQVRVAHLQALKQAVRLESVGIRHSSGRSMKRVAALELGLPRNAGYDTVLGALNREIDRRLRAMRAGVVPNPIRE